MTQLHRLQAQYANAVYQAARFMREAEIAKELLNALAHEEAVAQFGCGAPAVSAVAVTKGNE